MVNIWPSKSNTSIQLIFTSLVFRSTDLPIRAILYNGFPLCFKAEYIGGICFTSPLNLSRTLFILLMFKPVLSLLDIIFPSISSVSVSMPNFILAIYSFGSFKNASENLVALLISTIISPDAKGSRVPLWPILFKKKLF